MEPCLRALNIKFDAKLIHNIMNEERGAALRLLYQIKLAMAKSQDTNTLMGKTKTGLDISTLNRKLEEQLKLKTTLPASKMQTMNKSKKLEPIEKTLLTYEYRKKQ